jgi:hypothetical protein
VSFTSNTCRGGVVCIPRPTLCVLANHLRRSCMWNTRQPSGAHHYRRARCARIDQRTRDAGRPFLKLKSRSPGVRVSAISVFRVPHAREPDRTDLAARCSGEAYLNPVPGRPVLVPGGRLCSGSNAVRAARERLAAPAALHRGGKEPASAVPRKPPETGVRSTPTAGAVPRPHFQNHFRKRPRVGGDGGKIRARAVPGISLEH